MSLEMIFSLVAFLGLVTSWVVLPNGRRNSSSESPEEVQG